ncbi:protein of unknown function [Streptomyces sp. KY75]|nr:protein of unknown function [Streptomyces sp. KY75]CAD5992814.1 protein of unknown function [Streptomyces sp. KY70]
MGDPCYDELLGSADRVASYRRALGVPGRHRLVVLSSTWGPTSLIGQGPGLAARVLAALPYDEFRVAAIVHPNVWSEHGSWQIRDLLAPALDAGLMLVLHIHAWRSALVAADVVVGDHGSVTLYGAALGKPVLLGAYGSEAVPGTGRFARRSARAGGRRRPGWSRGARFRPGRCRTSAVEGQPGDVVPLDHLAVIGAPVGAVVDRDGGAGRLVRGQLVQQFPQLPGGLRVVAQGPAEPDPPCRRDVLGAALVAAATRRDQFLAGLLQLGVDRLAVLAPPQEPGQPPAHLRPGLGRHQPHERRRARCRQCRQLGFHRPPSVSPVTERARNPPLVQP